MISPAMAITRVCLVRHKVSFRMQHEGLLGEAYRIGLNPYKGDFVVFIGRHKKAIKLLFADQSGIWVGYKRFHQGHVPSEFKFLDDPGATIIAPSAVTRLIEGSSFTPATGL